jgi:hypothetical protein
VVITIARKPLIGSVIKTVITYSAGSLAINQSRIGTEKWIHKASKTSPYQSERLWDTKGNTPDIDRSGLGRWPANVIFQHHSACISGCFPLCPVFELDHKSTITFSSGGGGTKYTGVVCYGDYKGKTYAGTVGFGDSGTVSRFFKQVKS